MTVKQYINSHVKYFLFLLFFYIHRVEDISPLVTLFVVKLIAFSKSFYKLNCFVFDREIEFPFPYVGFEIIKG